MQFYLRASCLKLQFMHSWIHYQEKFRKYSHFKCLRLHFRWWTENCIGWLWCNGRIWPNVFFFVFQHRLPCGPHTSSIGVAELGFPWYRSSHPQAASRKSPQLQIWPHHRSDTVSQLSVVAFSCWGTENSKMVPNQKNVEGDQPVQSQSHAQQPLQPQNCVQSIVLVKQDFLSLFTRSPFRSQNIFLNYLFNVGLSKRKQCR